MRERIYEKTIYVNFVLPFPKGARRVGTDISRLVRFRSSSDHKLSPSFDYKE